MFEGFEKALGFLLLILLGVFLQRKIGSEQHLKGIKVLILSVALPATIFVALLKIELNSSLLILPLAALTFNLIMLALAHVTVPTFGIKKQSKDFRTLLMLLPSLAPGLSCFPFIMEFLGEEELALAALADVGNKIFVLLILYLLAMYWLHMFTKNTAENGKKEKIKSLFIALINEPINLVIIFAFVLLGFGIHLSTLPSFIENTILRLSTVMTPLVLLFIGMAVKIKWKEFHKIFMLLSWRSGITFCFSAALLFVAPELSPGLVLLGVVFPQSSCSFWPFAHMSTVNTLQEKESNPNKTFNTELSLSILAVSLPYSTLMILGIFSFQAIFVNPIYVLTAGIILILISTSYALNRYLKTSKAIATNVNEVSLLNK